MKLHVVSTLVVMSSAASLLSANGKVEAVRLAPGPASSLNLYVEKTGFLSGKRHHFVFDRFEGMAAIDRHDAARSSVNLRIEAGSLVCKDTWVSQSDLVKIRRVALSDMLAADRHAQLTFVSSTVRPTAASSWEIKGNLTIRGIARPATVLVTETPPLTFTGSSTIRLTDYGLKPPSAALGLVGTKNEMTLRFTIAGTAE